MTRLARRDNLATCRYDGLDRRIAKLVPNGENWDRTDYYYSTSWQVLEEYAETVAGETTVADDLKIQYVWDIRYIDAPVCRDEDKNSDGDCIDPKTDPDPAENEGDEHLYYCQDGNYNTTSLVDSYDGAVVERYQYDPYGKVTIYDDDWSDTVTWGNSKKNDILYSGYRYDHESRLYHVRHRHYHPTLGRWLQRDPMGYVDGANPYQYVSGNPTSFVDAFGFIAIRPRIPVPDFPFNWPNVPRLPTLPEFPRPSDIRNAFCDWLAGFIGRTFLHDAEGKRAWENFTSGAPVDIELSQEEMEDLFGESANTQEDLAAQEEECEQGKDWSWMGTTIRENYPDGGRWDEAIGHADLEVSTMCERCCLFYLVELHDWFDFMPRLVEGFKTGRWKWPRRPDKEVKVTWVYAAQQECGWKEFFHDGLTGGVRGSCGSTEASRGP